MSKNKDDEFDFEWDDDSSFDSKLDNFNSNIDNYHGDELKDAKKDRNPVIDKLKSVTPTISSAGKSVLAGAGKGIGRAIEEDMPSVYQAYQQGTHVLSEARIARQEISNKFKPWWNDTKRAIRKLSQQLEGQMPFGLDKKILKLVGEEEKDQQYSQPSKETLRQEQMNSNINQIFELQMQKSMEQQRDTVLNRTYDRRVDAIRHKESAGFLEKIAESTTYQHAFTSSVFTAYLKKDLELKYKQFYVTEDMLGVMTNHAKAVDLKLDAVIKNTALPEADKVYMSERISNTAKEKLANSFSDKLANYFKNMRENVVNKFTEMLEVGDVLTMLIGQQADMLETINDEDLKAMGGGEDFANESLLTKQGLTNAGFGKIGSMISRFILRKITEKMPQELHASLAGYFGGGYHGLALLSDDIAKGRVKGVPKAIQALLRAIAPDISNTTQTVVNDSWQNYNQGGKITNRFIQAVQEVIPGYLKMQTRYLEILATGVDSGVMEWDPRSREFRRRDNIVKEVELSLTGNDEAKTIRVKEGLSRTRKMIKHISAGYGSFGNTVSENLMKALNKEGLGKEIELFKANLAHSSEYYRIDDSILEHLYAIANAKDPAEIRDNDLYKIAFKDIKQPQAVAGFWYDLLTDRVAEGMVPNQIAIDSLNNELTNERVRYQGSHARSFDTYVNTFGWDFLKRVYGAEQNSDNNYVVDEASIIRRQFDTQAKAEDLNKDVTPEELAIFNDVYQQIQFRKANKKNWFLNVIKSIMKKLKGADFVNYIDNLGRDKFVSLYVRFNKDEADAEKKANEIWDGFVDEADKIRNNLKKGVNDVKTAATDLWGDISSTIEESTLKGLGKLDDSFNDLLDKLKYEDNGKTRFRSIDTLSEAQWLDWFASIEKDHMENVLKVFNGSNSTSRMLKTALPRSVQDILLMAKGSSGIIDQLREARSKYSSDNDKRLEIMQQIIDKTKTATRDKINASSSADLWTVGKENGNMSKEDFQQFTNDLAEKIQIAQENRLHLDSDPIVVTDKSLVDLNHKQVELLSSIDRGLKIYHTALANNSWGMGRSFKKAKKKQEINEQERKKYEETHPYQSVTSKNKTNTASSSTTGNTAQSETNENANVNNKNKTDGNNKNKTDGNVNQTNNIKSEHGFKPWVKDKWEKIKRFFKKEEVRRSREEIDEELMNDIRDIIDENVKPEKLGLFAKARNWFKGLFGNKRKHASGGSYSRAGIAYAKQLAEDKKIDAELRKKYKYGEYLDEKYSSAELMNIRNSLSPEEQQIFDAEFADFNNNWFPRFVNRMKSFRSKRQEKYTNGIPVIDTNKIDQNVNFSPWDREYINAFASSLIETPAAADMMGKIIWVTNDKQNRLPKGVLFHEASHILDSNALPTTDIANAHAGRGLRFEKHADWNGVKRLLASGDIRAVRRYINYLQKMAEKFDPDNITDIRWRVKLLTRAAKRYGYDLNQGLKHKRYAIGDNVSFDLPIDQYGGYVDQPTEILGGSGIAGEAGGETIIPHKFNERFKELIYRCLKDTAGDNTARRVLGMLNPSETTEDKLGISLSNKEKYKFAKGDSFKKNLSREDMLKRLNEIEKELEDVDEDNSSGDTVDRLRKEKAELEAQLKIEDAPNEEKVYTRKHKTDSIKNILLNIMESNEAIYNKLGDGLLVVDLASALDKLKDSELIKKLLNLSMGGTISNFIHSVYENSKSLAGKVWDFGANITHGIVRNTASFGRHLILGGKACDVFLGSEIEGQVHGDKKISASEIRNGTIFSDSECTKPIYSVADIYPPVYRKKIDEAGNKVVEVAIREDEAIHGLVDEHGEPLTYLGGRIGRFLHNIVMKPINAIFSKSALEKVSKFGSGIAKGFKHGVAGFFDAYCDVYSARDPNKLLVSGTAIKEGRLVRMPKEGGKPRVVPTVFDIDGECWIMVDDEANPGKRKIGNKVIYDDDIRAGLQHKDGTPIESSKISLAMSKLRRVAGAVGGAAYNLASGALHLGGTIIGGLWKAGGWLWKHGKEAVVDAFTAKNPYIDVYVIRNNEKKLVMEADVLKTNKVTQCYCYIDKDGKPIPVLSAYGISAPVYDMRGTKTEGAGFVTYDGKPVQIISQDDVDKQAIYDIKGNKLTKWAGRSLAGKIGFGALGAVKFGWDKLKKLGRGILKAGSFVVESLGSILGESGAAVTAVIANAWNSTLDLFRNTVVSRKDLQEIVGDRLLDIYGLLYKYMPRRKYIEGPDLDNDGDVDGSWEDYEQKRKERESKREQERLDKWYKDHPNPHMADTKEGFWSKLKSLLGFGGGDKDDDSSIGDYIFDAYMVKQGGSWFGRQFKKAGKGIKKGWGKLFGKKGAAAAAAATTAANVAKEPGKIAKAWNAFKGLFGKKAANTAAEQELAGLKAKAAAHHTQFMGKAAAGAAGKAGGRAATGAAGKAAAKAVGKGLFSKLAAMFGTRVATQAVAATAANAAVGPGQIVSIALWALTGAEIAYLLAKDSPKTKNMRSIRCKGYGISNKYWEAIIDLETDTFDEWVNGNPSGVDRDRLRKFGYKIDFMGLTGDDSSKVDFLSVWYKHRFTPMYQFYLGCMRSVGAEFESSPPKDDNIPDDRYAIFVNEFTKHVDKFCNGPTRILRLDKSAYTTWLSNKRKMEHEEGLTSGRYNDANLEDEGISNIVNKYTGKATDHYAYAWNEFKHGNWLNALFGGIKGTLAGISNIVTGTADMVMKNVFGAFTETLDIFGIKYVNKNEKAWDKVRFELYGLDESKVRRDEYQRITSIIKEFEIHQVHVIDGEYEIIEDELEELANKLFTAKIRTDVKDRLFRTNGFKDDTSNDLSSEAKSFTISWYKRIFLPIFTAYARVVRTACGDGPGDNIDVNDIPEENRLPLLKDFERQSKKFLSRNIDTEILRMSSDGFYTYLIRRSDEDKAELAKDANGIKQLEDLDFTDKLSRSLDESGKNFSQAWNALKNEGNVVKAVSQTLKGIGNGAWGIFKTTGNAIGDSIYDFVYGSDNKHRWETRFLDYGFASTVGSRDKFAHIANDNIAAMENFENESGRLLLEDNTSKPADAYFIAIMLHTGYLDSCCRALFGTNGTDPDIMGMAFDKKLIDLSSKYSFALGPAGWLMSKAGAISDWVNSDSVINSLPALRKYIRDKLASNIAEGKDKATKIKDIEQKITDMFNYVEFWYNVRFKPVFYVFANTVSPYNVNLADIDLDDIPNDCRKKALEEYKKNVKVALMKGNIQRYGLTPQGLAAYLDAAKKYREDIKDGKVDDKANPLAAYYKEKEDTYAREIIDTVANNMTGVSDEDKKHVTEALSKASVEIDNELGDVSFMAALSAKDALKDLGVEDIFGDKAKVAVTAIGKLMELTTGYNNYDNVGVGSGTFSDDKLGVVFTNFINDAHKYLYAGASAEDIHNYLTRFMNIYLQSNVFFNGAVPDVNTLDSIMAKRYPNVAASNATYKYFSYWFAHRFIPYYTYYVTLVNKANNVDGKSRPRLRMLTPMTRRYVILKLTAADKKNLIPNRARALKLRFDDMDKFYKRENALAKNKSPEGSTQRAGRNQLLKELEERNKNLDAEIANKRQQAVAESLNEAVENNNLDAVKAMEGVSEGAKVGGKFAKRKGRSLTEKERQEIWDFLTGRMGLTEPQAAAVMGNMMQESGMSCDVINGIGATGICQWLGSRLYGGDGYIGLIPFAKAKGLDPLSLRAQLEYFEWEVTRNPYERRRFDDYVRSVSTDPNNVDKTIAACAVGFRKGFERCGKHEAMDNNRVAYSKAFYDKFGGNDSDMPEHVAHYSNNAETLTDNITTGVQNNTSSIPANIKQYGYSDTDNLPVEGNESVGISGSTATSNTQLTGTVNGTTGTATGLPEHIVRYAPLKDDKQQLTNMANAVDTKDTTGIGSKLKEAANVKSGVNIQGVHPVLKDRFAAMSREFAQLEGHKPTITSGKRTLEQQAALSRKGPGAAKPGPLAPHVAGVAFDASSADMNKADQLGLLKKYGLYRPLLHWKDKAEPWHVEPVESRKWGGKVSEKALNYLNKLVQNGNTTPTTSAPSNVLVTPADNYESSESAEQQNKKPFVEQVKNSADISLAKATAEASANVKTMYTNDTVEQEPKYTYANMTGEGHNENIRTQNAMQTSITSANNGSAPIVAELQLISNILAGFRGDVNNFIGSLLKGVATQNNSNKGSTPSTTVKSNELVSNNIDEKVIKEMGDKLLAYVTNVLSTVTNTKLASNVQHTPRILADTYPLSSSKRG